MPRQEHVLSVFVASPGDVTDERAKLEEVVREFNDTWSRELGIRLELLKWETHAYPGLGQDSQAVINQQIPIDYDIFIGVMWHHFGTPTGRAGSGTIEEFHQAKKRYDNDPSSIKIMFYFKDAPIPPSKIDGEQLAEVANFRRTLGEQGGLHWTFKDLDDFERLLRIHLTRQVQDWKSRPKLRDTDAFIPTNSIKDKQNTGLETGPENEEMGFLDLIEISEERFEELTDIAGRIISCTEELGTKTSARTEEIQDLVSRYGNNLDRSIIKNVITKTASDMDQYVARMEAELPLFNKNLNEGIDTLVQAAKISVEFNATDAEQDQVREVLNVIIMLHENFNQTEQSTLSFQTTVTGLPRMTSSLNQSKRKVTSVLDRWLDEIKSGQDLTREAESVLRNVLDNLPS